MQTDIWLTQSAQPSQCPLCSKPLKASSKTCYACGFSLESPRSASTGSSVWIDPAFYTYQPPESAPSDTQSSEHSKASPPRQRTGTRPPTPMEDRAKPTGSVVWEGTTQSQPQTRQRTGGTSIPSSSKSPVSKSVAKPVHTRRRTYTRSISQIQDSSPSARPPVPQPPMWQYESPNFEAGSSLPALSLLIAETPTQPGIVLPEDDAINSVPREDSWLVGTDEPGVSTSSPRAASQTRRLRDFANLADVAAIDEIDTVPPILERDHTVPRTASPYELSTDDAFLLSGSSLISDAISAAEPGESAQRSALQSSWAPTSPARIDEIDTMPEINQAPHNSYAHVDQIDTLPELKQASNRALVPINSRVATIPATGSSWTAGGGAQSSYARRIVDRTQPRKRHSTFSLNPFDSVRWWLLRPGRIEFILWLGGTILLISVTCVLLLVTAFSLNWITPGLRSSITSSSSSLTSTSSQGHILPTVTSTPGLVLTLLDKGPFLPGQSIRVHGQGFTHNGKVVFTLDNPQLPPNPSVWSDADTHGAFTTTLSLGSGLAPGPHLIIAHDIKTDSLAALPFRIEPGDFGKAATATPAPAAPGATVTPTPGQPAGGGGGNPATPTPPIIPTPVNSTPGPSTPTPTPTPGTTPTPVPTRTPTPTPTPTVGVTPSPTPGKTPTPSASPTAAVPPAPSPTAAVPLSSTHSGDAGPGGTLTNALGNSNTPVLNAQLTRFAPWLWLPMLFYILSMFMLGLAGVLHKRRG